MCASMEMWFLLENTLQKKSCYTTTRNPLVIKAQVGLKVFANNDIKLKNIVKMFDFLNIFFTFRVNLC